MKGIREDRHTQTLFMFINEFFSGLRFGGTVQTQDLRIVGV